MSDAVIQQIGTSREVHENPQTKFVAEFIGNNNLFQGRIKSRSGSIVFVEFARSSAIRQGAAGLQDTFRSARTCGSPCART